MGRSVTNRAGSHFPLPIYSYWISADGSLNWHLLISSEHLRPGQGSLGFKHSRKSFIFQAPKATVEKMPEKCKERPQELSFPVELFRGEPHLALGEGSFLPIVPHLKSPLERSLARAMSLFQLGAGPGTVLGWQQLGPHTCRSSSPASQTHAPAELSAVSRWLGTYAFTPLWVFFFLILFLFLTLFSSFPGACSHLLEPSLSPSLSFSPSHLFFLSTLNKSFCSVCPFSPDSNQVSVEC